MGVKVLRVIDEHDEERGVLILNEDCAKVITHNKISNPATTENTGPGECCTQCNHTRNTHWHFASGEIGACLASRCSCKVFGRTDR